MDKDLKYHLIEKIVNANDETLLSRVKQILDKADNESIKKVEKATADVKTKISK